MPERGDPLDAVEAIKHRAVIMTAYGAGLRISEVCALQVDDIDSKRVTIRVRQGKGNKARYVILPERVLFLLRKYWVVERPKKPWRWLFPGHLPGCPLSPASVRYHLGAAARTSLTKRVTPHVLRQTFATHLLELGTDLGKVRHHGLMAASNVSTRLADARRILERDAPPIATDDARTPTDFRELLLALTGVDLRRCPRCGELAIRRHPLARPIPHPSRRTRHDRVPPPRHRAVPPGRPTDLRGPHVACDPADDLSMHADAIATTISAQSDPSSIGLLWVLATRRHASRDRPADNSPIALVNALLGFVQLDV